MNQIPVGSLFYASKHDSHLFRIEIRLRNYKRKIDKDVLFFNILKEQPQLECIVSYCNYEGRKTLFRSGIEFKILLDTRNTSEKLWSAKKIYHFINRILRNIVGEEQLLVHHDSSNATHHLSDIDRCPEIIIKKTKSSRQGIRWTTNTDYEPRFTKCFNTNDFHESHAIRKWALENIFEKQNVAMENASFMNLKGSSEFLKDYLAEIKAFYDNNSD